MAARWALERDLTLGYGGNFAGRCIWLTVTQSQIRVFVPSIPCRPGSSVTSGDDCLRSH